MKASGKINECREAEIASLPGHSKGKPAGSPLTCNITVWFAALSPVPIPIRQLNRLPIYGRPASSLPVWLMTGPNSTTTGRL